jgi:hypothetical protein
MKNVLKVMALLGVLFLLSGCMPDHFPIKNSLAPKTGPSGFVDVAI